MTRIELYRSGPITVSNNALQISLRNIQLIKNLTSCDSVPAPPVLTTIPECPVGTFVTKYWSNTAFLGHPDYALCESYPVLRDFIATPLGHGIPLTSFSATWEGQFIFESALYSLAALADDSISLSINNITYFSTINGQCCRYQKTEVDFRGDLTVATPKTVSVKFIQFSGGAAINFDWRSVQVQDMIPYKYTVLPTASLPAPSKFCMVFGLWSLVFGKFCPN